MLQKKKKKIQPELGNWRIILVKIIDNDVCDYLKNNLIALEMEHRQF